MALSETKGTKRVEELEMEEVGEEEGKGARSGNRFCVIMEHFFLRTVVLHRRRHVFRVLVYK